MTEFSTTDGKVVPFIPRKLGLRSTRNLLECIEGIKDAEKKSQVFDLIEKGVLICIPGFDFDSCDVNLDTAMSIMGATLNANVLKADERKKSE